jgi:uncharacterized protein YndB with AHSA1/START domain
MKTENFSFTLTTNKTPQEVFKAVTNVRGWWTGYHNETFKGGTEKLHDEFTFTAADGIHVTTQKLVEVIPNEKIVWLVTKSNLSFLDKPDEWTGTKVIFDISSKGGKTQLVFTHEGLTPEVECYDSCAPSWAAYLEHRLLPLIESGKGIPV